MPSLKCKLASCGSLPVSRIQHVGWSPSQWWEDCRRSGTAFIVMATQGHSSVHEAVPFSPISTLFMFWKTCQATVVSALGFFQINLATMCESMISSLQNHSSVCYQLQGTCPESGNSNEFKHIKIFSKVARRICFSSCLHKVPHEMTEIAAL